MLVALLLSLASFAFANASRQQTATIFEIIQGQKAFTGNQDEAIAFVVDTISNQTGFLAGAESIINQMVSQLNSTFSNPISLEGMLPDPFQHVTYEMLANITSGFFDEIHKLPNATAVLDFMEHTIGVKASDVSGVRMVAPYVSFLARMMQLGTQAARRERTIYNKLQAALTTFFISGPISMAVTGESRTAEGVAGFCKYLLQGILCDDSPLYAGNHSGLPPPPETAKKFGLVQEKDDWWLIHTPFMPLMSLLLHSLADSVETSPAALKTFGIAQTLVALPGGLAMAFIDLGPWNFCNLVANLGQVCNQLKIFEYTDHRTEQAPTLLNV
jgi:hypothetical protein